jgi:hypothetical protein
MHEIQGTQDRTIDSDLLTSKATFSDSANCHTRRSVALCVQDYLSSEWTRHTRQATTRVFQDSSTQKHLHYLYCVPKIHSCTRTYLPGAHVLQTHILLYSYKKNPNQSPSQLSLPHRFHYYIARELFFHNHLSALISHVLLACAQYSPNPPLIYLGVKSRPVVYLS